ncbi:ArsR/SmtB family transcription factor [Novosphingobium sp. JCM 18896]|uniref:ArsR/SmtB family transcription factor n=1 Tax=Novosphingobium sp. JCM 18896 TaxID=2989731 RepID=UPI0022231DB7|nr:helix-turn-helix domain-containing protein [Novosphingobium sp. JCM 18896]MCW1431507.1 helix-turn-helix domain-containing protein [Novosphingobium sp. JCM 18896]
MSPSERQDAVFRALASPARRALLDHLRDTPLTTGALCALFPELDRCSVMQHLKVLEAADLVIAERRGRERWNHLNPLPIHEIHERWIGPHAARAVEKLAGLKRGLEKQAKATAEKA